MHHPSTVIKVYLVDDHQMVIDGISSLLAFVANIKIVGSTNNSLEVLNDLQNLNANLVLTDISMPNLNGIHLTQQIKNKYPQIKVICLSMYSDISTIQEMKNAGADGYILKNTGKIELIEAINNVWYNDFVCPAGFDIDTLKFSQNSEKLTPREIDIVKLIEKEFNNKQIAEALFISERTVETHRKNIYRKTNTQNIIGLLKYAYSHHIL